MRTWTATPASAPGIGLAPAIYLIIGGIVAATHNYWHHLHGWKPVVSSILATVLWPLIFVRINLHIH
jgi:hypothetical protein